MSSKEGKRRTAPNMAAINVMGAPAMAVSLGGQTNQKVLWLLQCPDAKSSQQWIRSVKAALLVQRYVYPPEVSSWCADVYIQSGTCRPGYVPSSSSRRHQVNWRFGRPVVPQSSRSPPARKSYITSNEHSYSHHVYSEYLNSSVVHKHGRLVFHLSRRAISILNHHD